MFCVIDEAIDSLIRRHNMAKKQQKNDELAARKKILDDVPCMAKHTLRDVIEYGSALGNWGTRRYDASKVEDVKKLRDQMGRARGEKLAQILKNKHKAREK